jgi:RNA polymerase sigma-70 factor (ECF subfamily)
VDVSGTAGRDEALARLARSCARKGHAIARDLLGDSAEAEDVVQESLARACQSFGALRDPAALEGWFFRVLTNLCMRTLRRRRVYASVKRLWSGDAVVAQEPDDDGVVGLDLADQQPRADDALGRAGDVRQTLHAVGRLPVMQRTAVVLRYGHDLSVGEIAAVLDVGEGTVKTHLVRALSRLRELTLEKKS